MLCYGHGSNLLSLLRGNNSFWKIPVIHLHVIWFYPYRYWNNPDGEHFRLNLNVVEGTKITSITFVRESPLRQGPQYWHRFPV